MSHVLRRLGRAALDSLAEGLRSGRLTPPYTRSALSPHAPKEALDALHAALHDMHARGMGPAHIAWAVALLAEERAATQAMSDRLELVWSPPELDQVDCRDTSVVVQELFRRAEHSILIVTYVFDQGDKAAAIFGELAARMDAEPTLAVRIIANVKREHGDATPAATLARAFFLGSSAQEGVAGGAAARGLLRPARARSRCIPARGASRQVRGDRRALEPHYVRQFHRGRAVEEHRGRRSHRGTNARTASHAAVRSPDRGGSTDPATTLIVERALRSKAYGRRFSSCARAPARRGP